MLDLAKLIHDAIGIESPRKFVIVCALVGFVIFGCLGWLIDKGYRVKLIEQSKVAPTIHMTTTGPQSPILPNNSGNVTISNDSPKPKDPPPKDKSK
jgi:hypothetical protein